MRNNMIPPVLRHGGRFARVSEADRSKAQEVLQAAKVSFPPRTSTSTSSVERVKFVSDVSSSVALKRIVELSSITCVASSPAFRANPKDALKSVFQDLQRAARAKKVSHIVERLAIAKAPSSQRAPSRQEKVPSATS